MQFLWAFITVVEGIVQCHVPWCNFLHFDCALALFMPVRWCSYFLTYMVSSGHIYLFNSLTCSFVSVYLQCFRSMTKTRWVCRGVCLLPIHCLLPYFAPTASPITSRACIYTIKMHLLQQYFVVIIRTIGLWFACQLIIWHCCLQCFDTVGWAAGRASGQ